MPELTMARKAERKLVVTSAFAGDIGDEQVNRTGGGGDEVEQVAPDGVAGDGAHGERVAGDCGHLLRQERALDEAGVGEIGFETLPGDGALMEVRVFDGDGSLDCEGFKEVELVEGEGAVGWENDDELVEDGAGFVAKREGGEEIGVRFSGGVAVGVRGVGEEGAGEFELADDDLEHGGEDAIERDGGVDEATGLEESLEADDLLLRDEGFVKFHEGLPVW
jgi:hypothetical protein